MLGQVCRPGEHAAVYGMLAVARIQIGVPLAISWRLLTYPGTVPGLK